MINALRAPFPYFGGKRSVADLIWCAFGSPKQYIEPFCGSAAVLLAAPRPASLEVVNDLNGFIANFWRAVKHQPGEVAQWADYPVSHIDLGARHVWLMRQREHLAQSLQDPDWPGDAKVAGWWLWGQCCWIGSGWCDWFGQVPHATSAGMGIQALGKVPHATSAGMGIQALGKVPHASDAGRGIQALGQVPHAGNPGMGPMLTSSGEAAWHWLHRLAKRLERVRVTHGEWQRCLNNHYGAASTAVFLDPPYEDHSSVYGAVSVSGAVQAWALENSGLRVAVCGLRGEYALPGWTEHNWSRGKLTYSGAKTTEAETIWFSPACQPVRKRQGSLFGEVA
jgi:hypothetical protein